MQSFMKCKNAEILHCKVEVRVGAWDLVQTDGALRTYDACFRGGYFHWGLHADFASTHQYILLHNRLIALYDHAASSCKRTISIAAVIIFTPSQLVVAFDIKILS